MDAIAPSGLLRTRLESSRALALSAATSPSYRSIANTVYPSFARIFAISLMLSFSPHHSWIMITPGYSPGCRGAATNPLAPSMMISWPSTSGRSWPSNAGFPEGEGAQSPAAPISPAGQVSGSPWQADNTKINKMGNNAYFMEMHLDGFSDDSPMSTGLLQRELR